MKKIVGHRVSEIQIATVSVGKRQDIVTTNDGLQRLLLPRPVHDADTYSPSRKWNKESNFMWAYNCDFTGQDLPNGHYTRNDILECGSQCSDDPQCNYFSWSNWDNRC